MVPPLSLLRCPASHQPLIAGSDQRLITADGEHEYRVVDGVPILLADQRTVFGPPEDGGQWAPRREGSLRALVRKLAYGPPTISRNVGTAETWDRLAELVCGRAREAERQARVLVVGGASAGVGFARIADDPRIETVETDVALRPRTEMVCDGHDLPFVDDAFDGVICQAVLEHVIDPPRVVAEIHRVLADHGIVYSEVPFMQQVHGGAHDFQRFSHLGHLRLFHMFDELDSGAQGGPGMALAWSVTYFLRSFAGRSAAARALLWRLATLATFWLKYLDGFLARTPGGLDAASGTYFLGRRRADPVPDRQILDRFRGAGRRG